MGVASLSVLGGKNVWAESVRGAVGVRCPDLRMQNASTSRRFCNVLALR